MSQDTKYLVMSSVAFIVSLAASRAIHAVWVSQPAAILAFVSGMLMLLNGGRVWNQIRGTEPQTAEESYATRMRMEKRFAWLIGGPALIATALAAVYLLLT